MAGKTGADAVFIALKHICRVIIKYNVKLNSIIDQAEVEGVIDAAQATAARAFVSAAQATCLIFELVADFNSLTP